MGELYYPTLDLFFYDLKEPLNATPEVIEQNKQNFIAKLPPNHQFKEKEQQEYYWGEKSELPSETSSLESLKFYPVLLHDVYGLRIDCSVKNLIEPQLIDTSFTLLHQEIQAQAKIDALTFGQTWLASGWLRETEHQDPENLAKICYQSLTKNDNWQQNLYGQGKFLNGYIFELWQPLTDANEHIVILLLPNQEMAKKAASFYKDWMGLFCFRHKISLAYRQSRLIKNSLTSHYQKVDNYAKVMRDPNVANPSATNSLDTMQNILNQYTIDLLNLSFQKQTITTNLLNYQIRSQQIKQKADAEKNLDFLDKFSELVQQKYLIQIDKDLETMQLGLKLLETNFNAIRSRIELEKSERDRNFQTLVTFIGTGTATVAIIKDGKQVCEAILQKKNCEPPLSGNLVIPLILIVLFGYVGWLVKREITIKSQRLRVRESTVKR